MCGIVGILSPASADHDPDHLTAMMRAISHRGPDDAGTYRDYVAGVSLGHRRLSVIDLSEAGHQPMVSASGRYVVVFNGEIYNHESLRERLQRDGRAPRWRGHSDTETFLAYTEAFGLVEALKQSVGMFAIGMLDREDNLLRLARDRCGEKPLYYAWQGGCFTFASELSALRRHPSFRAEVSRDALCLFMRHNYVPAPYTIFIGISKLLPGSVVDVSMGNGVGKPVQYWAAEHVIDEAESERFKGTPDEAVERLDGLLRRSISGQMAADVPVGVFLSGGIDSSTVAAIMQASADRPVKTFTIGFSESLYNEATYAAAVAAHLHTDHTELYVTSHDALKVIPELPTIYSEPFSDSSAIPTYLVSRLAREHVTVALSGDGGDELFGGYGRYTAAEAYWRHIRRVPAPVRQVLAQVLRSLKVEQWNWLARLGSGIVPHRHSKRDLGRLAWKVADALSASELSLIYNKVVSHWAEPTEVVRGGMEPGTMITRGDLGKDLEPAHRMMAWDMLSYLPDDILCKVDRAAMAASLETRVPLLDHRLVEFAWSLPLQYKRLDGRGKWPLRKVLARYVPPSLTERPKMGFGVPIDSWLRGPLREWAESLLDTKRLSQEGYFDPAPIQRKWIAHVSGEANWAYHLWDVLMFQAWLETQ